MPNNLNPSGTASNPMREICQFLSPVLRQLLAAESMWDKLEEIRIRSCRPLMVIKAGDDLFVDQSGQPTREISRAFQVSPEECDRTWQLMNRGSLYSIEEEMRRGYLTLPGGHRVGIAGKVVLANGEVRMIRDVTGLNVRVARAVLGAGEKLLPRMLALANGSRRLRSTLFVSSPQCGKTTLLRDLARLISYGDSRIRLAGHKVVIVDERSEIAASYRGVPQHDVGPRTDVLDGCPKAEGAMMALRGMSPQVLITDEIGRRADVEALIEARNGGVTILASAHGASWDEVQRRPVLRPLWEERVFEQVVVLDRKNGPGSVAAVISL